MLDYTNRVKKIINEYAPNEAKRLGHEYMGPEHILMGISRATDSVAMKLLMSLGIDPVELRNQIEARTALDGNTMLVDPAARDKVQRILEYSREEAQRFQHTYIGSEHLLLALMRETQSPAAAALADFNVTYQIVRNELNEKTLGIQGSSVPSGKQPPPKKEAKNTPIINEFGRDLTRRAQEKKTDPVIGRDKEIERLTQILTRRTKNNPILIGEAGVGKTAVVEGLAAKIANKMVPEILFNKRIVTIDMAAMIAGTKYRGEFEDRIKKLMKEVRSSPDIILFVDELHTIIGAGAAEGAMDAANMLKPSLARGELQMIGATTLREYKKYFEKDSALERRFQTVMVEEPNLENSIRILAGLRHAYEKHHGVAYTREAIKSAVTLSRRFINDRHLPDKAIDIIDEAGARARLCSSVLPDEIRDLEKEVIKLTREKNEMVREQLYEKAAKLRDRIVSIEKDLEEQMQNWRKKQKEDVIRVDETQIASVISSWTGIPLEQLSDAETAKLLTMHEELTSRVVGQTKAVEKISRAIRRARTGLKSPKRPAGTFIFLGPTGVGKTQLAKEIANFLFGSSDSLIRFDMSEYMEPHSVSKFIGSPPGYVGHDEGGLLTEKVRRKPYSVVLFDEIEKSHRDIQNILLQVLDEGELSDGAGRKISFRETIIIMTSNLGAEYLMKGGRLGFNDDSEKVSSRYDQVQDELRKYFSPEFLNRIDEIVLFESLQRSDVGKIVEIMIREINQNILSRDIFIELEDSALAYFAEKGYDEKNGARPLGRLLQNELEDAVAMLYLEKTVSPGSRVIVSADQKVLSFRSEEMPGETLRNLKKEYLSQEELIDSFWDESFTADENVSPEGSAEARTTAIV